MALQIMYKPKLSVKGGACPFQLSVLQTLFQKACPGPTGHCSLPAIQYETLGVYGTDPKEVRHGHVHYAIMCQHSKNKLNAKVRNAQHPRS